MRWHLTSVVRSWSKANLNGMLYLTRQEENYTGHALLEYSTYIKHFLKRKKKQPNKKTNENVLKREKAVPRFLMNLRFIHLNQRFYYKASITCHSQLSAYSKGNTHSTSAALTSESYKNFNLTYFQKLTWFYLLATKDSLLGKVSGKTFSRCEIPWTAFTEIAS